MKAFHAVFLLILQSCATSAYYQTEDGCNAKGVTLFPANYYQYEYTAYRNVVVPTGNFNCSSKYNQFGGMNGSTDTNCKQESKNESQPYRSIATADSNEDKRNAWARECIRNTCYKQFGNVDCESK